MRAWAGMLLIGLVGVAACSAFGASNDPPAESGSGDDGGASSDGGSSGQTSSGTTGTVVREDASTACLPGCRGILCEDFIRLAPAERGWSGFSAEVELEPAAFKIETPKECSANLRVELGNPRTSFAARMLRRTLSGTRMTIELDLQVEETSSNYGANEMSILAALTPADVDLSLSGGFAAIAAVTDNGLKRLALVVQAPPNMRQRVPFSRIVDPAVFSHLEWTIEPTRIAVSIDGITVAEAPVALPTTNVSAAQLFIGLAHTAEAPKTIAHFDNVVVRID